MEPSGWRSFFAKILPGTNARLRVVSDTGEQIFDRSSGEQRMNVALKANLKSTGELLATSFCTVTNTAKVVVMEVRVKAPAKLAALIPSDVRLATTIR